MVRSRSFACTLIRLGGQGVVEKKDSVRVAGQSMYLAGVTARDPMGGDDDMGRRRDMPDEEDHIVPRVPQRYNHIAGDFCHLFAPRTSKAAGRS